MFSSLFKSPRSFRLPAQNGPLNIQRVKISQRLKRPAFVAIGAPLLVLIIAHTSDYWLPEDFRKSLDALNNDFERAKKEVETKSKSSEKAFSESWQKAHDKAVQNARVTGSAAQDITSGEQTAPIVIGLPISFRKKLPPPFGASDPEWKEFVKLQEDNDRREALFRNIAHAVNKKLRRMDQQQVKSIFHSIEYAGEIGVGLEIRIPLFPPAPYEIPGLRFGPTGIGWTWKTLPESYGSRLRRTFHPVVFAKSFWVGVKVFCKVSYLNARSYFDENVSQNKSSPSSMVEVARGPWPGAAKKSGAATSTPDFVTEVGEDENSSESPTQKSSSSTLLIDKAIVMQAHRSIVGTVTSEGALKQAVTAFRSNFLSLQVAAWREMPRGAVTMEGWIDFIGHRGMFRTRVVAIYMPAEDKFLGEPVIEAMKIFPYAPEWYKTRTKRAQQRIHLPTQDHNEAHETAPENEEVPTPSPPMKEAQRNPSGEHGGLNEGDQKGEGPEKIRHENTIQEKSREVDGKRQQSKTSHDGDTPEKDVRPEKKEEEKNGP